MGSTPKQGKTTLFLNASLPFAGRPDDPRNPHSEDILVVAGAIIMGKLLSIVKSNGSLSKENVYNKRIFCLGALYFHC